MMFFFEMKLTAARRGFIVSSLAVLLFLAGPCLYAQDLNLDLVYPYPELLDWHTLIQEKGFSISFPTAPLLERKLKFKREVKIDYDLGWVELSTKAGNYPIGRSLVLDLPDYISTISTAQAKEFWLGEQRQIMESGEESGKKDLIGFEIPVKFPKVISKIVGEGGPGLKVNGYKRIGFAGRSQWQDGFTNTATSRQSKFPSLEMEQESRFTITGTIGSKITVQVDQDSRRMTDLENNIQLRYNGEEDEIIKSIELGNTSWSIPGLAGYSGTIKGLFGAKATAQLGGLDLTVVASQEKGSTEKAVFQAGAEVSPQFIRDYEFSRWRHFYLGKPEDFSNVDSILELEVFLSNQRIRQSGEISAGAAYINPDSTEDTTQVYWGRFQEVTDSLVYYYTPVEDEDGENHFWIKLSRSLGEEEVLGLYYRFLDKYGVEDTVGNLSYNSGSFPGSEDDTTYVLKLIKPEYPKPSNTTWDYEWKNVYSLRGREIQKEGFELRIYKGQTQDIEVDKDYDSSGVPYIQVLGLDSLDLNGQVNPDNLIDFVDAKIDLNEGLLIFPTKKPFAYMGLDEKVNEIYDLPNTDDNRYNASKYYIYVKSASRKMQYPLGKTNIIEGSEIVTLNGERLTRGVDYNIIYELGQINFITDRVLDPTANVTIDYEYAPIFMLERKTLFGMNADYDMGNLRMGLSALYKSEKTAEDRPRVGQEPTRNFVWDANLSYNTSPSLMTKLADVLPLIETDASSNLSIQAEVAQSLPNPNTKNDAFIDDFEGSLEYTDLGIRRGIWTLSSTPVEKIPSQRGRMIWYNPWDGEYIRDIWPEKETTVEDQKTHIFILSLDRNSPHIPANASFSSDSVAWNGIMRALPRGSYDQSKTEFLEIWVYGDSGKVHIDLGQISEDIDGDGILDTEDKEVNGWRNGQLDSALEDRGLDGWFDVSEQEEYDTSLSDPSGDNWHYSSGSDDYSHVNGTEGNAGDPDRGRYPDTEDIDHGGKLDKSNDYFEFTIDLLTDVPTEEITQTGWKLYRIPLKDISSYEIVGNPDWSDIRFARVWVEECSQIKIASFQLVGNRWRSLGIASIDTTLPESDGTFKVFVINTHENPGYSSPPGVAGEEDPNTKVREKEQSLVLKYDDLDSGYYGVAYRYLYRTEDYTNYKNIKMYVHGPNTTEGLKFFFRLGTDSLNFYEYYTKLEPGWSENNYVLINFEEITGMKSYMLQSPEPEGGYDTTQGEEGHYRIRGKPSLSRINWFCMGAENVDTSEAGVSKSGEIWVDELRVADIRRESGWAINTSISAKFADLLDVSFSLNRTDSEFHNLRTNRGSGVNTTNKSFNSKIYLEKFLPPWWGLKLPFSYSWSKNLSVPRLKSGSDIVLPDEQRDEERTQSTNESFRFDPSFKRSTKNWVINWTLNRISTNMSYNRKKGRSPTKPTWNSSNYWVKGKYDLSPPKKLSLSPLSWSKNVFLLKKLSKTKFYYLPTNLIFDGQVDRLKSFEKNEVGGVTSKYTRDFNGGMNWGFVPFDPMSINYTWRTNRDIRNDNDIKFSLNPKKFRLGIERTLTESFRVSYNPRILSFLDHNFSFNSNYNENSDPNQFTDGTRSVRNSNTKSVGFTFRWQKFLGKIFPGDKPKSTLGNEEKTKTGPITWIRKQIGSLVKNISPLQGTVSRSKDFVKSGLLDRPSFKYQLGLTDDLGVGMKSLTGTGAANDNVTVRDNYTLKSGIKIFKNANLNVSYTKAITDVRNPNACTESKSKTFPDLNFNWGNVDKFKILKRYISSLGFKFGYSKKVGTTKDKLIDQLKSRNTTTSFSPLASFSISWKNGIRTDLTMNKIENKEEDLRPQGGNQTVIIGTDQTIGLNNSYSFRAPHGIKLPLLKKIKFESNLTLSLDISHRTRKQKKSILGNPFNLTEHKTELSISPRAGYNFSSQVQAGLSGTWADANDKIKNIKTHVRQFGIWVEIRF